MHVVSLETSFFYSNVVEISDLLLAMENSYWHFWTLLMKFIGG
jgi:hypothetical protein